MSQKALGGVAVADVIKALALVVQIAPAWVRVPPVTAMKMGFGNDPLHRRCPNDPGRTYVDQPI